MKIGKVSKCSACGGSVTWVQTAGKWQCFNAGTTTDHWDECSKRKFERIRATGEYFVAENATGYLTDLKPSGIQYTMQTSGLIAGRRKLKPCSDCVPPWEVCPRPCLNAISKTLK